ncbi:MAG: phosphatidate cytidylyltransferase [Clostridia bacterium]
MKTRLLTAALGIVLFFTILFLPPMVFHAALMIIVGIATYEIYAVTGINKNLPLALSGCFGIALCALLGCMHLGDSVINFEVCLGCLSLYIVYIFCMVVFDHKNVKLSDASVAFFTSVFIAVLYSYIIPLREDEHGIWMIIVLFAATWCCDAGAYFIGIKFGKHKLAPVLSPKKTIEGFFGGILGSVVGMGILSLVLNSVGIECNEIALMITGVGCSLVGPVGDIATSAIKREANVKDFGNLFPGHGGILDRFDSILLTTPFVYFMNEIFNLIG